MKRKKTDEWVTVDENNRIIAGGDLDEEDNAFWYNEHGWDDE